MTCAILTEIGVDSHILIPKNSEPYRREWGQHLVKIPIDSRFKHVNKHYCDDYVIICNLCSEMVFILDRGWVNDCTINVQSSILQSLCEVEILNVLRTKVNENQCAIDLISRLPLPPKVLPTLREIELFKKLKEITEHMDSCWICNNLMHIRGSKR